MLNIKILKTFKKMISSMNLILNFDILRSIFRMVLDKHAPIKSKKSRGNYAPFMSNESSNAIMNTS